MQYTHTYSYIRRNTCITIFEPLCSYISSSKTSSALRYLMENLRSQTREVPLEINGKGCALLIIDLQNFCVQPNVASDYYRTSLPETLKRVAELQSAFRSSLHGEVLYTVIENQTLDGRDISLDYKISGLSVPKGSIGAQVFDPIKPIGDEMVIPKTSSSAFMSTNLDYVLRCLKVEQLVIVGGLTDQCVSSAVRDACDLGYLVTVVTDATIAKSEKANREGLSQISGYARHCKAAQVVAELEKSSVKKGTRPLNARECLRILWCDAAGFRRARMVPAARQATTEKNGLGVAEGCMSLPAWGDVPAEGSGLDAVGEFRLVPDPSSYRQVPWHTAHMFSIGLMEKPLGTPWECCPRYALKRALTMAKEKCDGMEIYCGFEIEFQLFRYGSSGELVPFDSSAYASSTALNEAAKVLDKMLNALVSLDIECDQVHSESASGQFEIVLHYGPALKAVDDLVYAREAITAIANEEGLVASFLPKTSNNEAGNGCHAHFSIMKEGKNVFGSDADNIKNQKLSRDGAAFMAGVLNHLPALLALCAPSPNSFRRLVPSCWAGAFQCWGVDNRECPIRLATPPVGLDKAPPTNFEIKSFDATGNPFLSVAGVVVCGINGILTGSQLPDPIQVDPASLPPERVLKLPMSVSESVDALCSDDILTTFFGDKMIKTLSAVNKSNEKYFQDEDIEKEFKKLLRSY